MITIFPSISTILMSVAMVMSFSTNSSPLILWITLEMMTIGMVWFLLSKKSAHSVENLMKFFLVQSFSSLIWLITAEMLPFLPAQSNAFIWMLWILGILALWLKMGFFPFHQWAVEVISHCTYSTLWIMMTVQKIIPTLIFFKSSFFVGGIFLVKGLLLANILFITLAILNFSKISMFFFLSGMLHFMNIFFILSNEGSQVNMWTYFFFYSTVFFGFVGFVNFYWISGKGDSFSGSVGHLFFMFFMFSGFPPSSFFFFKLFFFWNIHMSWEFLFLFFYLVCFIFYMYGIMAFFLENMFTWKSNPLPSSNFFKNNGSSAILFFFLSGFFSLYI